MDTFYSDETQKGTCTVMDTRVLAHPKNENLTLSEKLMENLVWLLREQKQYDVQI